jgi:drug/metabolite transporter (DMT)-like permease
MNFRGLRGRENLGLLLGLVATLGFAGTLPATRISVQDLDPWFLTFARAAFAGIAAVALLLATRRRVPARQYWGELAIASVALVYGFPLFSALAMETVPAAHGGVVLGIVPMATALAATLVAGERPSVGFWLAAAAGGVIVVAFALRDSGSGSVVAGDIFLLGCVASAGIGYTYAGKLSNRMPGWEVICWALVLSLPFAVPATIWLWPADTVAVPLKAWGGLAYITLISQFIAFFFWNAGLALGGIARVGQIMLLQPFLIVLIAAGVNNEPIEIETLLFAAAVIATVAISRRMRIARPAAPP